MEHQTEETTFDHVAPTSLTNEEVVKQAFQSFSEPLPDDLSDADKIRVKATRKAILLGKEY